MVEFEIQIVNFQVVTTGADGGHVYIATDIQYGGNERRLTVVFADRADEQKIKPLQMLYRTQKQNVYKDEPNTKSLVEKLLVRSKSHPV
jgi:hypothetical protein